MFPILRRHWTLWAIWTAAAFALLFADVMGVFGWPEVVAGLGSLVLIVDRRVRREPLLVIGLPVIALLATVDGYGASVLRLMVDWFFFIGAVLLAARAVDDQRELESIAGQVALGSDPDVALETFRRDVADEVARSRRHERPFVVLSVSPQPGTVPPLALTASPVLERLAHARCVYELEGVLRDALHRYAGVVATDGRVLCRVPEVEEKEVEALADRLAAAVRETLSIEIQTGVACFPRDALAVDDLIDAADEARTRRRLARVSHTPPEEDGRGGVSARAAAARLRDVRG